MEVRLQNVPLLEIGDTLGTPPNPRFKKSVRKMGVIQPVLLAEETTDAGEIQYLVIDGNRRIHAARRAKHREVPAVVISGLSAGERAQLTLVANGFRSPNYLTEFWAIKTLERNHISVNEIIDVSGMSDSVLATRARLSHLNRDIFVALRNGKVSQANAITIAKMRPHDQAVLGHIYNNSGRILKRDVDEILSKTRTQPPTSVTQPTAADEVPTFRYGVRFSQAGNQINRALTPQVSSEGQNHQRNRTIGMQRSGNIEPPTENNDSKVAGIESNPLSTWSSFSDNENASSQLSGPNFTPSISAPSDIVGRNSLEPSSTETASASPAIPPPLAESHMPLILAPATNLTPELEPGTNPPATPTPAPEIPTIASRTDFHLRNAVRAAHLLEFSREDFLASALRIWDESVRELEARAEQSRKEYSSKHQSTIGGLIETSSPQMGRS